MKTAEIKSWRGLLRPGDKLYVRDLEVIDNLIRRAEKGAIINIDGENLTCEFCAEKFKNILDLDTHQWNNRYCQEAIDSGEEGRS